MRVVGKPHVHPCLCGFTCPGYAQMKHHRRTCEQWRFRRDPVGLTIARRVQTCKQREQATIPSAPRPAICLECRSRCDHHEPWCSQHQEDRSRREALEKHGIDQADFNALLRLLTKRYVV